MVVNSIIWGNEAATAGNDIYHNLNSSINTTYSDIDASGIGGTGAHNPLFDINQDPVFVNPQLASAAPTPAGDYRLQSTSPCIDAGSDIVTGVPDNDIDGDIRPQDGNASASAEYDMGADEYVVP
jgi:hypothetical protein